VRCRPRGRRGVGTLTTERARPGPCLVAGWFAPGIRGGWPTACPPPGNRGRADPPAAVRPRSGARDHTMEHGGTWNARCVAGTHRQQHVTAAATAESARERNGPGWNVGSRTERGSAPDEARAGPGRMPGRRRERGAASAADDAAEMGARWMPRRWRPRKDAATRRNARGRRWQPAIPRSPNGATRRG
jgi:hypothetical protein